MLTYRPVVVLLMSMAARHLEAQTTRASTRDTLTIVNARPQHPLRLTLSTRAGLTLLESGDGQITADTLTVTAPARIELPRPPFSIDIRGATAADSGEVSLVRNARSQWQAVTFFGVSYTAPITLSQAVSDSGATVKAGRMTRLAAP